MADLKNIGFLPVEAVLGSLLNFQSNSAKLKMMEVATTGTDYFTMPEKAMNKEEIMRSLIDIDEAGDFAIRVGFHSASGSTKLTKAELTEEQLLQSIIGKTSDGKPYLKLVLQEL